MGGKQGGDKKKNGKPTAAIADVRLIEWHAGARGHTYANCSFVVAARAAVHESP